MSLLYRLMGLKSRSLHSFCHVMNGKSSAIGIIKKAKECRGLSPIIAPHTRERLHFCLCREEEEKNPGHYPSKKENSGYFTSSSSSYRRCCCGGPPLSLESFATIRFYFFYFFSENFIPSFLPLYMFFVFMGKHLVTKFKQKKRKTLAVAELPLCVTSTQEGGEKSWRRR